MLTPHKPQRFVLVTPACGASETPSAIDAPDQEPRRNEQAIRQIRQAVADVTTVAESVLPPAEPERETPVLLRELDAALALSFADPEIEVATPPGVTEQPKELLSDFDAAASTHPASRVSGDRRTRQGTRDDRADSQASRDRKRHRAERAAEFARALEERSSEVLDQQGARGLGDMGNGPRPRVASALEAAVAALHTALAAINWPLRSLPSSYRVFLDWVAISLMIWTAIVWVIVLFWDH